MNIPLLLRPDSGSAPWAGLDAAAKRDRLLETSREVFIREGLDAPMPAIAVAAGVGVGSVYRQFPSKLDLLSALVVERLVEVEAAAEAALSGPEEPWKALVGFIWDFGARQSDDAVVAEAMSCVLVQPEVEAARARVNNVLGQLIGAAREAGGLRADATVADLRILFAGARAAEKVELGGWRRMIQLGIDAFDTGGHSEG